MANVPKILFYVEVFTELDRPEFHSAWVDFSAKIMAGLAAAGHPVTQDSVRLVTNEALAPLASKFGIAEELVATVRERPFLDIFGTDYLTAMVAGYRGTLDKITAAAAGACIRDVAAPFIPDVVITYTTAPWLHVAFPDAVILHNEYGAFSRPPYPESFYFDPHGKFANAILRRHADELRARQASAGEQTMIAELRQFFCEDILRKVSPFHQVERALRQYSLYRDKVILLPLQFCGHYGFEGTCTYRTQGALMRDVIERISARIGVLAIEHSTGFLHGASVPSDLFVYLGKRHPNLFTHPNLNKIVHPSQYLLAHTDGVATVSSSVGLQALLWDKPIIALGDSHINAVADYTRIEDIPIEGEPRATWDKSGALAWLLTHYYIPAAYCRNGAWFGAFLDRSVRRWREGRHGLDFFDPVDTPEALTQNMRANANLGVPFLYGGSTENPVKS